MIGLAILSPAARRAAALLGLLLAVGLGAGGCSTTVKGSWSCVIDRGGSCGSIADIDRGDLPKGRRTMKAMQTDGDPLVGGAVPAVLEHHGGRWPAGPAAGAPVHESDQIVKVVVAPWIDRAGDYHGPSEIYAVVRKGGWFIAEPQSLRRVDLTPDTMADTPPPVLTPAADVASPALPPPGLSAARGSGAAAGPAPSTGPAPATGPARDTTPPGVTVTRIPAADGHGPMTIVASTPVPNPPPACPRPGRRGRQGEADAGGCPNPGN